MWKREEGKGEIKTHTYIKGRGTESLIPAGPLRKITCTSNIMSQEEKNQDLENGKRKMTNQRLPSSHKNQWQPRDIVK